MQAVPVLWFAVLWCVCRNCDATTSIAAVWAWRHIWQHVPVRCHRIVSVSRCHRMFDHRQVVLGLITGVHRRCSMMYFTSEMCGCEHVRGRDARPQALWRLPSRHNFEIFVGCRRWVTDIHDPQYSCFWHDESTFDSNNEVIYNISPQCL